MRAYLHRVFVENPQDFIWIMRHGSWPLKLLALGVLAASIALALWVQRWQP